MTLNIKLGLLGVWKEVCTVFHSILAQIPLIYYRKKKKMVKLLTIYWDSYHILYMELQGPGQEISDH